MEYCTLSEQDTESIIGFCRANKLGLNSLLSAAVLMAEWQLRRTPNIPVPYVYPVDLRYLLSPPPVSATESTNPVGIAPTSPRSVRAATSSPLPETSTTRSRRTSPRE